MAGSKHEPVDSARAGVAAYRKPGEEKGGRWPRPGDSWGKGKGANSLVKSTEARGKE